MSEEVAAGARASNGSRHRLQQTVGRVDECVGAAVGRAAHGGGMRSQRCDQLLERLEPTGTQCQRQLQGLQNGRLW